MNFHFDAVFYYVSDLDAAIHFYRDLLGFPFVSRDIVARFDLDGVLFEIVPGPVERGPSNARLCLKVENVTETLAALQVKGVRVRPPEEKPTGVLGRFEDIDGNEICLWEYRT